MARDDEFFEPWLGRPRATRGRAPDMRALILSQMARTAYGPHRFHGTGPAPTAPGSDRFNARGRGGKVAALLPSGSRWSVDRATGQRVRSRRVTVKVRIIKLAGRAEAVAAHLRYLERDGTARDGKPARFYSTFTDEADATAITQRGQHDRHQFRLIVAPEDGPEFESLRGLTRDLMAQLERDLATTLDWVAVDHFDTGHPHSHVLIRGVTEDGKALNIAGDYIAHGIRHRASEIMTRALGPQSALEVQRQLEQEVDAERLTRLDRAILLRTRDNSIDLRQSHGPPIGDGGFQQMLIARLRHLEKMKLASRAGALSWALSPGMETVLSDMGQRGNIVRTMRRAMAAAKLDRRPELYVIHDPATDAGPIIGRIVHLGAVDHPRERHYLIVDGIDGCSHYVDIGTAPGPIAIDSLVRLEARRATVRDVDRTIARIAAASNGRYDADIHLRHDPAATETLAEAHVRRLEAIHRATGAVERLPTGTWSIAPDYLEKALEHETRISRAAPMRIETLSTTPVERLVDMQAATWLDRALTSPGGTRLADHGFGADVRRSMTLRQQWLIDQQLAERDGLDMVYRRDMLQLLRRREVQTVAGQLAQELGMPFVEAMPGEPVDGICRRAVTLTSGKFALIEKSREFTLVPWRPELEKQIGRPVSGMMRSRDSISWTIGRDRGGPTIT